MSYLVLARKFRPQTFAEMVGQEHVTRTLSNAIAQGRLHHAFLFTGARGVGKTTAARILAKCLSCEKAPTPTPCGVCDACREITAGTSVDVQEIDGASNNSVEDVRALREGVRYLPSRGKKKVYIIDEVHMLSGGAFNALLKTLEEPPPHVVFVFATTEPHRIPITILSRVQRYDFRLVSQGVLVEHLARLLGDEKIAAHHEALRVVVRAAGGSVRDALSLVEQLLTQESSSGPGPLASAAATAEALGVADGALVGAFGQAIVDRQAARALDLVARAADRSVDMAHLARSILEQLRNLVVVRTVEDPVGLVEASSSELEEMMVTARRVPAGLLELLFARWARTAEEVARSPVPRAVLEVGLIELGHVEPLAPIGELVDRLERLEGRLERRDAAVTPAAAPRPPAPTRSAPATPPAGKRTFVNWQALSEALFERSHRFAIFLHGKELTFAPPKLAVAFKNDYEAEQARERLPDALPVIAELLGMSVTVAVSEGDGQAPSVIEAEEARQRDERERRRQEALAHPLRNEIRRQFGDDVTFKEPEVD